MSRTHYRPGDTDERLRSWLDGNQLARERLCISVLSLDPRFRDVRPRHPRGGPDGGRDIEARLTDGRLVWAAVGFRNSVSDSPSDRAWVKRKFAEDLSRALAEPSDLKGFVFFTNVEFPAADRESLIMRAKQAGMEFCDVFHRERMRLVLDSPDGLAARYQYLDLSLSDAEQATFFARWGGQLEALVTRQFAVLDRQLARLEFLHACTRPLRTLGFDVELREPVSPATLGHFRVLLLLADIDGRAPHVQLALGLRDEASSRRAAGGAIASGGLWIMRRPVFGHAGRRVRRTSRTPGAAGQDTASAPSPSTPSSVSTSVPRAAEAGRTARVAGNRWREWLECETFSQTVSSEVRWLSARGELSGWLRDLVAVPTLGDLDGNLVGLFTTEPVAARVASIHVLANEYAIVRASAADIRITHGTDDQWRDLWPSGLTPDEGAVPWVRLSIDDSATYLEFSETTPESARKPATGPGYSA